MPEALSASAWREVALGLGLSWSSAVGIVSCARSLVWPGVLAVVIGSWLVLSALAMVLSDAATANRIATGGIVAISGLARTLP
jgi:hypothetical protein